MELLLPLFILTTVALGFWVVVLKHDKKSIMSDVDFWKKQSRIKSVKRYVVRIDENIDKEEFRRLSEDFNEFFSPHKAIIVMRKELKIEQI